MSSTSSPIAEIKDKLNLVDIASRYTHLEKAGSNGRVRGLCPLHTEKTPSFFVFTQTQRWHCFGCNTGGDVLDLVQATQGWDFPTALSELAREAGVDLQPLTPEQRQELDLQRARERVLGIAAAHWQQALQRPNSPGLEYARSRGWTEETLVSEGLGYHHDVASLRAALVRAGVDIESPTARAVLSAPVNSLIYPHMADGHVVYYAARSLEEKRHYNPPADLAGPRRVYYNHKYTRNAPSVIIVEGQGDAASLAQLDYPAVARAGADLDQETVKLLRQRHKQIFIGVENDPTGQKSAHKLAAQFGALCRLVTWGERPKADANDLLRSGATPETLNRLLKDSPTWLDVLIRQAQTCDVIDTEDAIRAVFSSLVGVDAYILTRLTDPVCAALNLTRATFTAMLKLARLEAGQDQNGRPLYEIIGGQMCLRQYDRNGGETIVPLLNAAPRIVCDIVSDDGQTQTRLLEIHGDTPHGKLPPAEVTAEDFAKMTWLLPAWGARVIMSAGNGAKEHLRAAIQTLSPEVQQRHEYTHLGWRTIEGQSCYLTANGALGRDGIVVRPPGDLQRYTLTAPQPERLPEALRASLRFLDVGKDHITIPLWAAIYLAPLASVVSPAFSLWLFGTTGSLKSSVTALAMCHYGKFSYNIPAPASWTSTTAYALRVKAFLCKDAPLWIDDYAKQSTAAGQSELNKLAETMLREFGNRTGRSAGQANGSLRTSHDPRGLVISTAEQLPPNPSIHPRLYAVEIHPGDIPTGPDCALTRAQNHDAALYPTAMAGYITWLAGQMDGLAARLHARREELAALARQKMQHLRSPMNVATMYIGYELGMQYLHSQGILTDAELEERLTFGWDVLVLVGSLQDADINREEDPIKLYFEALDNLLLQGSVYLRHRDAPDDVTRDKPTPGNRQPGAALIGWYDDQHWYLLDKPAYNAICDFYRHGGTSFPDSARGVKVKLLERGMLIPDPSETYRHRLIAGQGQLVWVHRITRTEA